jgi:hypothetical protein
MDAVIKQLEDESSERLSLKTLKQENSTLKEDLERATKAISKYKRDAHDATAELEHLRAEERRA